MKRYTPRKKKEKKPVIQVKRVRIDHRTQIEVAINIPDDVAIARYYERHTTLVRPPVDEIEEIDDSDLPEEED